MAYFSGEVLGPRQGARRGLPCGSVRLPGKYTPERAKAAGFGRIAGLVLGAGCRREIFYPARSARIPHHLGDGPRPAPSGMSWLWVVPTEAQGTGIGRASFSDQ